MDDKKLTTLSDTMMGFSQFLHLINYQTGVNRILQQEAPNLIKCIESSLMDTETTCVIESLDMPNNTQMITFRSDLPTLNQEQVQHLALESVPQKELFSLFSDKKLVSTTVRV